MHKMQSELQSFFEKYTLNFSEGQYLKAKKLCQKQYRITPNDILVLWYYSKALYMLDIAPDSILILKKIRKSMVDTYVKKYRFPNSWGKAFLNACNFQMGCCYIQMNRLTLAKIWLEKYISNCGPGIRNWYPASLAKQKLKIIRQLIFAKKNRSLVLWTALLEIRQETKSKKIKYKQGFTNAFVMANSSKQVILFFEKALDELGFALIKSEDIEEFDRRILKRSVADEFKKLGAIAKKGRDVVFSDFIMYPEKQRRR